MLDDAFEAIGDIIESVSDLSETAPGCAAVVMVTIVVGVATWYFFF